MTSIGNSAMTFLLDLSETQSLTSCSHILSIHVLLLGERHIFILITEKIIIFYVLTFRFVKRQRDERLCVLSSTKHFLKVICSLILGHVMLIHCYSNE